MPKGEHGIELFSPKAALFQNQDHQHRLMAAARKANAALFQDYRELMDTVISAMPKGEPDAEHFDMALQLFGILPVVSLEAILDELSIPLTTWNRWRHKHPDYTAQYKDIAVNKSNRNVDAATRLTNLLDGFPSNELIKLVDIKTKLLMKQAEWLDPAKKATAVQINQQNNSIEPITGIQIIST